MARPGIMLYFDILEPIRELPDKDKGQLLIAMLEYGRDGKIPKFKGTLAVVWGFIKPKLDRDSSEYAKTVQKRQYATFCRTLKKKNLQEISFDEWVMLSEDEKCQMISCDTTWYPTTTGTTTGTRTGTPSTNTNTTATSTAAVAGTTGEDFAAAAADRKLKVMNGELGKGVVNLSEHHIDLLLNQLGVEMFDYYVAKLADFIIRNGATVKGHYQTILKWWTEDCSC